MSHDFGYDRGTPIDRYYIERFLLGHRSQIRGRVLEVKDSTYTDRFGSGVSQRDVLDIDPANSTRPVLGGYSVALVDQLVAIVAASTISAYSLYTFTASDSSLMMVTIPFVLFGLFRYLQLVHARAAGGEEPERTLVTDAPLLVTIVVWAVAAVVILIVD